MVRAALLEWGSNGAALQLIEDHGDRSQGGPGMAQGDGQAVIRGQLDQPLDGQRQLRQHLQGAHHLEPGGAVVVVLLVEVGDLVAAGVVRHRHDHAVAGFGLEPLGFLLGLLRRGARVLEADRVLDRLLQVGLGDRPLLRVGLGDGVLDGGRGRFGELLEFGSAVTAAAPAEA
jgi:hypothetical protein